MLCVCVCSLCVCYDTCEIVQCKERSRERVRELVHKPIQQGSLLLVSSEVQALKQVCVVKIVWRCMHLREPDKTKYCVQKVVTLRYQKDDGTKEVAYCSGCTTMCDGDDDGVHSLLI